LSTRSSLTDASATSSGIQQRLSLALTSPIRWTRREEPGLPHSNEGVPASCSALRRELELCCGCTTDLASNSGSWRPGKPDRRRHCTQKVGREMASPRGVGFSHVVRSTGLRRRQTQNREVPAPIWASCSSTSSWSTTNSAARPIPQTVGILIYGSRNEHTVRYALNQSNTPWAYPPTPTRPCRPPSNRLPRRRRTLSRPARGPLRLHAIGGRNAA
jgi:hypothetical protein